MHHNYLLICSTVRSHTKCWLKIISDHIYILSLVILIIWESRFFRFCRMQCSEHKFKSRPSSVESRIPFREKLKQFIAYTIQIATFSIFWCNTSMTMKGKLKIDFYYRTICLLFHNNVASILDHMQKHKFVHGIVDIPTLKLIISWAFLSCKQNAEIALGIPLRWYKTWSQACPIPCYF